MCEC
jgi:Cu-Zn family superoxide dismutase